MPIVKRGICVKVGIPRSLFYYKFISLWETFFVKLGVEVVVSDATNKQILDDGVKACVDEACLPIKLFHGHVINLKDRVDYIFVPRFTSISRNEYICPEFGGLPDMVRHTIKGLPSLITAEINMRKSDKGLIRAAVEIAAQLGADKHAAEMAFRFAMESYEEFSDNVLCGALPFSEGGGAVSLGKDGTSVSSSENCGAVSSGGMRIAVIGHSYNLYDKYISMDILNKLQKSGVAVTTIEMVQEDDINRQAAQLPKPMFWNYGRNAYGAALHLAAAGEIDGMICVTSFGCGIDSFVHDLIEKKVRRAFKIPFITITVDEHSGEAGFNTRLEAFVDMLHWRRLNENNISAFG